MLIAGEGRKEGMSGGFEPLVDLETNSMMNGSGTTGRIWYEKKRPTPPIHPKQCKTKREALSPRYNPFLDDDDDYLPDVSTVFSNNSIANRTGEGRQESTFSRNRDSNEQPGLREEEDFGQVAENCGACDVSNDSSSYAGVLKPFENKKVRFTLPGNNVDFEEVIDDCKIDWTGDPSMHGGEILTGWNNEDLTCPICFEIFCSSYPRIVLRCGDCSASFCGPCLEQALQRTGSTCPMCRHDLPKPERNQDIEIALGFLPGSCEYCGVSVLTSELNEHEDACEKRPLTTSNQQEMTIEDDGEMQNAVENGDLEGGEFWSCQRCTFFNEPSNSVCEVCYSPKPIVITTNHEMTNTTGSDDDSSSSNVNQNVNTLIQCRNSRRGHLRIPSQINSPDTLQMTLLWRSRTKMVFLKWKPALVTLTNFTLMVHDTHLADMVYLTDRNALRVIPLHPGTIIEPVHETKGCIVSKSRLRNGSIVRSVSPSQVMYRTRIFIMTQSQGSKREKERKLLIAQIGSASRGGLEGFAGALRRACGFDSIGS